MTKNDFLRDFLRAVVVGLSQVQTDNIDYYRYPVPSADLWPRGRRWIKDRALAWAARNHFVHFDLAEAEAISRCLVQILDQAPEFARFYDMLGDAASRDMLIAVLAFRVLGNRHVKLPVNNAGYGNAMRRIRSELLEATRTVSVPGVYGFLDAYNLENLGFPIRVHAHLLNVLNTFWLQQYRYHKAPQTVQVRSGDIVIDGGGCWGDTALYFACLAGADGHVFSFEFAPGNLAILQKNLEMNPHLSNRIEVVPEALWSKSGELLDYSEAGAGTCLTGPVAAVVDQRKAALPARTRAIDDWVIEKKLRRVDFIKLDIEGAEARALQGAARTLEVFRPKLAISIYHKLSDFVEIPHFLKKFEDQYEFFLDHFTIHHEETVLYGCPIPD